MGGEYSSYEVILKFSDRRLLFILSMHMWGYQLEIAMSCANFFNDAWDSPLSNIWGLGRIPLVMT